ncbi:MAG: hypothetical protein ACKOPT_09930 [Cyanobium sp.]
MSEPAGPGPRSLGAIQARLDEQIPQLYRDLALYLQVLRDILPASLDQACSHMATQVHPRRYNRLHPEERQQLHGRLKDLLGTCCSLLTVEQLFTLASQMEQERHRLAHRDHGRLLQSLSQGLHPPQGSGGTLSSSGSDDLPLGSIQLQLTPPLSGDGYAFSIDLAGGFNTGDEQEEQAPANPPPLPGMPLSEGKSSAAELPWASGQFPRDPVLLIHCLDGLNMALGRMLRNLSHGVNLELNRAGLVPGVVPVPLIDAVLSGQIEPQGAPANLLRLAMAPTDADHSSSPPLGVLLRTVDLEMEQPRLRTCRRRLVQHRQDVLKMAETSHRLQRRLQAHHAERLWRHDSQLNPPPQGI